MEEILDGFEAVTDQEWREKILKDIKGNFQDLLWQDENKLVFQPYYRKSDLQELHHLKEIQKCNQSNPNWQITQLLEWDPDKEEAILQSSKKALESGVNSILIKNRFQSKKLETFLAKNQLDSSSIMIEQYTGTLQDLPQVRNTTYLLDPISDNIVQGKKLDMASSVLGNINKSSFGSENFKLLVDASTYKNAGANHVQELAYLLQHSVEYLDFFTEQGIAAETIASNMVLKVGIGTSFFSEIALVRALKFLWKKMLSAYKTDSQAVIIAESSSYYLSKLEPYNNLIRETTQVMSAAFANCNFITSPSFDMGNTASNGFSERMVRNIQLILKEESYANMVADPSAGSYYIEAMSEKMADAAWEKFLKIEEAGGLRSVYENGKMQEEINISHQERLEDMAEGKLQMLGVNIFKDNSPKQLTMVENKISPAVFTPLDKKNLSEEYLSKEENL